MMFRPLLAATACAVAAHAFLIPLEVADSAIASSDNGHANIISPSNRVIKLDCPGCDFAQHREDGSYTWVAGLPNALILNFTTDDNQLLMNGRPFYPNVASWYAPQVRAEDSLVELKAAGHPPELILSGSFAAIQETPFVQNEGRVFGIDYQITGINGQEIKVDTVHVRALQVSDGKFMILTIDLIPNQAPTPFPGQDRDEECTLPPRLCRANALLASKVAEMKANIAKARARLAAKVAAMKGGIVKGCHGRFRPHHGVGGSAPMPHHHHHAGSHHHRHGSTARKVARIFAQVVLPILVGVAAGMAASALGMLLGRLIVFFWIRYRRGGQKGSNAVTRHSDEAIVGDGEKDGLLDEQMEHPPVYEELEGVAVKVQAEKETV